MTKLYSPHWEMAKLVCGQRPPCGVLRDQIGLLPPEYTDPATRLPYLLHPAV